MSTADYILKIEGIQGESTDDKHKGAIDLLSWSWGETNPGSSGVGGGQGTGKVSMQDFHFVMRVNKASPKLLENCAKGEHMKEAVLICRKSGSQQQEYLTITLSNVVVSKYQSGGSSGDNVMPTDQVSLNFEVIKFDYKEQKEGGTLGGTVHGGWNIPKNIPA